MNGGNVQDNVTENINPALWPLRRGIDTLKHDARNARTHDARSVASIAGSLKDYGQQKTVVALADGTVIAGNGTLDAARSLGWKQLAVVVFEDAAKARAYALADNRTAELSAWDPAALQDALTEVMGSLPTALDGLWSKEEMENATQAFDIARGELPDLKPGGPETNVLSFTLTPAQLELIRGALDRAKEQLGGGKPAACLEHICRAWGAQ